LIADPPEPPLQRGSGVTVYLEKVCPLKKLKSVLEAKADNIPNRPQRSFRSVQLLRQAIIVKEIPQDICTLAPGELIYSPQVTVC